MGRSTFRLTDDEKKDIDDAAKQASTYMRAEKASLGKPLDIVCDGFRKFLWKLIGKGGRAQKQRVNQMVSLYRAAIIDYLERRI